VGTPSELVETVIFPVLSSSTRKQIVSKRDRDEKQCLRSCGGPTLGRDPFIYLHYELKTQAPKHSIDDGQNSRCGENVDGGS